MSTITVEIVAGNDDAYAMGDGSPWGRADTSIVFTAINGGAFANQTIGGFRFNQDVVTQGATINQANFRPYNRSLTQDDVYWTIGGEDVDFSKNFQTGTRPDERWVASLTTATVNWHQDGTGTGYVNSPDIATVVQEIFDRPNFGLTSWPITILFLTGDDAGANKSFNMWMRDGGDTTEAQLYLDYTAGGSAVPGKMRSYRNRRAA